MQHSNLAGLGDRALLRALTLLVAQDRITAAELLAHLAEVDARRLYLPAGYSSMHAYCVGALRFSEAAAFKRIQAARVTREFPRLLPAVADGRLHLTAVCMLAAHLTANNLDELVLAAASLGQSDLVAWLARRFAPPVAPLPLEAAAQLAPGHAETPSPAPPMSPGELALRRVEPTAPSWPSAPPKSMLHLAITDRARAKLARAQALLGHEAASGDLAQVVERALDALIAQLEKREARSRQRAARPAKSPRTIPARVKREVWRRDQGQCAYVGLDGQRCPARKHLEFDHLDPVARGGRAQTHRLRLLCRAHNQFEAERVYGEEYMRSRRARTQAQVHERAEPLRRATRLR